MQGQAEDYKLCWSSEREITEAVGYIISINNKQRINGGANGI